MVLSALAGLATLYLIAHRSYLFARIGAVGAMAAVVRGWGVAQYPWILRDQVKIADAAGARATLVGLLAVVGLAVVLVVPGLAYLFWLTQSEDWTHETPTRTG